MAYHATVSHESEVVQAPSITGAISWPTMPEVARSLLVLAPCPVGAGGLLPRLDDGGGVEALALCHCQPVAGFSEAWVWPPASL